jgi:hypothetical protein
MILELEKGFGELIHISPQPMREAARALETQSNDDGGAKVSMGLYHAAP